MTLAKQFDVFVKSSKTGWKYYQSVEARTAEEAKTKIMKENTDLQKCNLTAYPKR